MSKHTPGPWFAEKGEWWQVWHNEGIAHIAKASKGVEPDQTGEANARLIAAAPDLLEALKESLEREFNPFEPDNQSARYKRWAAVIAKAEGGTPCAD
jgi:hypothetical protein